MMTSAIYLTGSTFQPLERIAQMPEPDWRTLAMTRLQRYGFRVLNPLELSWSSGDAEVDAERERRVRRALDLINQSDAVLANLFQPSYGTAMEIFYAFRRGKMVAVIGQSPFSPWVLTHSQARFEDIEEALNYLIGEQPQIDKVNWALQYESVLAERYEQFPPDGEPDYQFLGGELPVLAFAPHGTAYFREGEFQEPDAFTGSMAALLNRMTRCHALTSFYCCAADPCGQLATPMRRAMADIVRAGQVRLVLLLLGSSWQESPGLNVSAMGPDEKTCEDLVALLRLQLSAVEPVAIDVFDHRLLPLMRFVSGELGATVVAVKMHKRYRMPRLQPELFLRVVDAVREFVEQVGTDFLRARS